MRVNVHTTGRFWLLELAIQLAKHGCLHTYLTTEPAWIPLRHGLPKAHLESLGHYRLWEVFCARTGLNRILDTSAWLNARYAARSARVLGECDLLVHIAYGAQPALAECRRRGIVSVLSHGNTHFRTQEEWVHQAYVDAGLPPVAYSPPFLLEKFQAEYEAADCVEVPTELCAQTFVANGFQRDRTLVNPFPVDTQYWFPEEKPDPRTELRFLFAGSIQARKGVATLLEAWKRAKPERAGLYFSVSGIWEDMKPVLARYEGLFTVLMPLANQALFRKRINGYHVLVLPSYEEGFSFAVAQGMACEMAPLCSTRSGGQEVLKNGESGLLVEAGDVAGLEHAIRRLCSERDLWRELGRKAREVCLKELAPEHYGRRAVANYLNALAQRALGTGGSAQ